VTDHQEGVGWTYNWQKPVPKPLGFEKPRVSKHGIQNLGSVLHHVLA